MADGERPSDAARRPDQSRYLVYELPNEPLGPLAPLAPLA
jgi:hypothetical protein